MTTAKTCSHGGTGLETTCEECLEAQLHWTAKASELTGLATAEKILRDRAGVLFGQRKAGPARADVSLGHFLALSLRPARLIFSS